MLWRRSRRGEIKSYTDGWVWYGDLWEGFRRRMYWWNSIKEWRKLALILVIILLQVPGMQAEQCWVPLMGVGKWGFRRDGT